MDKQKVILEIMWKLEDIKCTASKLTTLVEENKIFPDYPTRILDISCLCDDIIGELSDLTDVPKEATKQ